MRRTAFSALAAIFALSLAAGCVGSASVDETVSDSTLMVVNDSDFAIEQIYITDTNASGWGPNMIGGDVLLPGEDVTLTDIPCGSYDVRLVAEDGFECQLLDHRLCFDDATWELTNDTCDVFHAKALEKAQAEAQAQ